MYARTEYSHGYIQLAKVTPLSEIVYYLTIVMVFTVNMHQVLLKILIFIHKLFEWLKSFWGWFSEQISHKDDLQHADHLKMLTVHWFQSKKIGRARIRRRAEDSTDCLKSIQSFWISWLSIFHVFCRVFFFF